MPELRPNRPRVAVDPGRRRRMPAGLAGALALLGGVMLAAWAPVALAVPGPGNECDAEAAPSGVDDFCEDGGSGGGSDLGSLLLLAGAVVLGGAVALGGTFLFLRRRAAPPLDPEPVDAGEWWSCGTCGRNNVVGSARCYSCGAWQR